MNSDRSRIVFTEPQPSTVTVDAFLTNVQFHEEDMVMWAVPNSRVVCICSNFGEIMYDGYTPEPPKAKSNRGRKRKEKTKENKTSAG